MNLNEIADLQFRVGKHRLQMSAAENFEMSIYGDFYIEGRPMISMMVAPTEIGRAVINRFGEMLHPDVVTKTHDSYFRFGKPEEFSPENYEYGSLGKAFEAGDKGVSESLIVVAASNDEAQITHNIPYSRVKPGEIQFDANPPEFEEAMGSGVSSGRISDEIVDILSGERNQQFIDVLLQFGKLIPEVIMHVYRGAPWDNIERQQDFEDRWTRTDSGYVNVPKFERFDELINLMDVTVSDEYRLNALRAKLSEVNL